MFKFLGMVTGAILMLIAGIAWLDAPQAKKLSSQLHSELDIAIEQIAKPSSTITVKAEDLSLEVLEIIESSEASIKQGVAEVVNAEALPLEVLELIDSVEAVVEQELLVNDANPSELSWHIFWMPFHSLSSAKGFAALLSKQTGVAISTITNDKNQHTVTFSYFDEEDKQRILQLIKDKTGLQVSAS